MSGGKAKSKVVVIGALVALAMVVIVPRACTEYKERLVAEEAARAAAEAARRATAAIAECDAAASHPGDPQRYGAAVADDRIALGQAIEACERANRLNPGMARIEFQLGRGYWLSGKEREALVKFNGAAERGHAIANKFIGDAYLEGRGLPDGSEPNASAAIEWYKKAQSGGVPDAAEAIANAEGIIRRNTFEETKFQYGDYMKVLHDNTFDTFKAPIALAYYAQGLVRRLDDDNTLFMDPKCKALLNIIGNKVVDNADVLAVFKLLANSSSKSTEQNIGDALRGLFDVYVAAPLYKDYGNRDATVLFDREIYGCDSRVTQRIVKNIMIRLEAKR